MADWEDPIDKALKQQKELEKALGIVDSGRLLSIVDPVLSVQTLYQDSMIANHRILASTLQPSDYLANLCVTQNLSTSPLLTAANISTMSSQATSALVSTQIGMENLATVHGIIGKSELDLPLILSVQASVAEGVRLLHGQQIDIANLATSVHSYSDPTLTSLGITKLATPDFRVSAIKEPFIANPQFLATAIDTRLNAFAPTVDGLQTFVASIEGPSIRRDMEASSFATMANLAVLGNILKASDPFSNDVSQSLRVAIGDMRLTTGAIIGLDTGLVARNAFYTARGFDARLVDLPEPAFGRALVKSGVAQVDLAEIFVVESDDGYDNEEFAYAVFQQLRQFERELRTFLNLRLTSAVGEKWMRARLDSKRLQSCEHRQTVGKRDRQENLPLYDYLDFTDYDYIITRDDNWRDCFATIFHRKEDIRESLVRLGIVRLPTAHSRPVGKMDLVQIASEIVRIRNAIKWAKSN